ncbi:hypothetical protein FRB90_000081 [Tulasnella sp. 427]|nr:hypothetical protein FRB90_000081 [Tulasnella sp. 427]
MGNTESSHRKANPSSEWAPGFPTERHYIQAVARSLSRGCPGDRKHHIARRPPLPTELVLLILRKVGATTLCRELCCTFPKNVPHRSPVTSAATLRGSVSITARDASVARLLLFASPVVEQEMLHRLVSLRVDTISTDQGWVSDPSSGSWSWIEVGIVRFSTLARDETFRVDPLEEALLPNRHGRQFSTEDEVDTRDLHTWESHHNPVAGNGFALVEGKDFGPEHEIWSTLQAGDRIGVWLCAQFPGWQCRARAARITALSSLIPKLYELDRTRPALFVDLEGFDLCRHGRIALITIYASPMAMTYLVDVTTLGEASFTIEGENTPGKTLKSLLEDKFVPKVLFDCRNDSDALYNLYKVDMAGVVDLQLMELATRKRRQRSYVNGLARTIRDYAGLTPEALAEWEEVKNYGKKIFDTGDPETAGLLFEERPLDEKLIQYSIQDATLLPVLYDIFDKEIQPKWRKKVEEEVEMPTP